jgi:hypothetical protein
MRKLIFGLTAAFAVALAGPAWSQAEPDGFQQDEQPGSEFELDVDSDGKVEFGRESTLEAEEDGAPGGAAESNPLEIGGGDPLGDDPLDDPDNPVDPDPIDEELPGEGPESLSGPDDDDPLPY